MFFSPELPAWVLLPMSWLFALVMIFSLWLILCDFVQFFSWLVCRLGDWKRPAFFTDPRWRAVGLIPGAILVSIGMYEGLKVPEVRAYTVSVKRLPRELDGMKILHLTDLHVDPMTDGGKVREIVRISGCLGADLIVLTGDFVDGRASVRGTDVLPLKDLRAPMGVFGVPGNHEYYSGYAEWMDFLRRECGIGMLENQHVMIAGGRIALGGVTDPAARRTGGALPDVAGTFAPVPPECFKILMSHQPKLAYEAAAAGVDLQLSGHTHGGMIPGMDLLVGAFNKGFFSGLYEVGEMKMFVSNGAGMWGGFPVRLGHPSEIALITLKCR